MAKKTRRGQKQCPNCKAWIKGTRAKSCPKCGHDFTNGRATAPTVEAAPHGRGSADEGRQCDHLGADQGSRPDGKDDWWLPPPARNARRHQGSRRAEEVQGFVRGDGGLGVRRGQILTLASARFSRRTHLLDARCHCHRRGRRSTRRSPRWLTPEAVGSLRRVKSFPAFSVGKLELALQVADYCYSHADMKKGPASPYSLFLRGFSLVVAPASPQRCVPSALGGSTVSRTSAQRRSSAGH